MSTLLGIALLTAGPVLGAIGALALGATRTWQAVAGAIIGEGVSWLLGRAWSAHAAERATARALATARTETGASFLAGGAAARPTNVVIRATGLPWRDHLVTLAVFSGFAVLVGALVATVWQRVVPGY